MVMTSYKQVIILYWGLFCIILIHGVNPDDRNDAFFNTQFNTKPRAVLSDQNNCSIVATEFLESFQNDSLNALLEGSLHNGALSYQEAIAFLNWLVANFPNDIQSIPLGSSVNKLPITAYRVGGRLKRKYLKSINKKSTNSALNSNLWDKNEPFPEVLVTSLHHSRESCSLTTLLYFITKLLQDDKDGHVLSSYILTNREIWVIPIVNPDGFSDICTYNNLNIRKNRKSTCPNGSIDDQGVDLNRNYAFNFDDISEGCSEEYGGEYPFSEPETQAIRNLVASYKPNSSKYYLTGPLKFILHLHTYGDFWTHPYNCCPDLWIGDYSSNTIDELQKAFGISMGNAKTTLDYIAYGEADDWALNAHNIISMSPEVSSPPENIPVTERFWPTSDIRISSHLDNYPRIIEVMKKAGIQANFHLHMMNEPGNYSEFPTYLMPTKVRETTEKMFEQKKIFSVLHIDLTNTGLSGSYGMKLPLSIQFVCKEQKDATAYDPPELFNKFIVPNINQLHAMPPQIFFNESNACAEQIDLIAFNQNEDRLPVNKLQLKNSDSPIWVIHLEDQIQGRTPDTPGSPSVSIFTILEYQEMPHIEYYDLNMCLAEPQLEGIQFCQCGTLSGNFNFNLSLINTPPGWIHSTANIYGSKQEPLCIPDTNLAKQFSSSLNGFSGRFTGKLEITPQWVFYGTLILLFEGALVLVCIFLFYKFAKKTYSVIKSIFKARRHPKSSSSNQKYTKLNRDMSHESLEEEEVELSKIIED